MAINRPLSYPKSGQPNRKPLPGLLKRKIRDWMAPMERFIF
jgi:hypothetical protein